MKYLIVGLGNIGSEYAETRHNTTFKTDRYGDIAEVRCKGRTFLLLKPSTYMNLSGNAVRYWLQKEKIELSNTLIVVDDLALPLGTLRLRGKGSDGGHNGLKSIDACVGSNNYPRLRCGIGHAFQQGQQVDYVLGEWLPEERETLNAVIEEAVKVVRSFALQGIERTMNQFNKKGVGKAPKTE